MAVVHRLRPSTRLAKALLLSWALLAGGITCAQSAGPGGVALNSSPTNYTLTGTVVNSVTADPIRRALVQAGEQMQLTDEQGRFELSLPAGRFVVQVVKPGYFSESQLSGVPPAQVAVGPEPSPVVIKLVPEGVVLGQITDPDGEPMRAVVRAFGWEMVQGRRQLQDFGGQTTDEDGRYRIFNLMPGTYYLRAEPSRPALAFRQGYSPAYFPGVSQFSAATPLQVGAGQKVQADLTLHPTPAFQIAGRVTGYSSMGDVELVEAAGAGARLQVDVNPATGTFVARGVPAGSYKLVATGTDAQGRPLEGETAVNVSADRSGITVTLAPPAAVPVIVQTEFTHTALTSNAHGVFVRLSSLDAGTENIFSPAMLVAQTTGGHLTVPSVKPGRYWVEASPTGPWYVQSLVSGSTDLFSDPLVVGSAGEVAPIQVLLRDDGASLGGEVRSQDNGVAASVLAVRPDEPLRVPWRAVTTAQGTFRFDNLPPGDYVILAFDNIASLEYANPDALRDYLSQGTQVSLSSKDTKTVDVDVIHR